MQGLLAYQISDDVGILPLVEGGTILHMFRNVVTSFIPADADLFTLVEATAKHPSWQQGDADVSERWQGPSGVIALVMLDKILLSIKDAVAANNNTGPVLSCLVHPHFMLLPIRLCLESFEGFLLGTISTEHVGLARLALILVVSSGDRRCYADIVCRGEAWFGLDIKWAADVRGRGQEGRHGSRGVKASRVRARFWPPHSGARGI